MATSNPEVPPSEDIPIWSIRYNQQFPIHINTYRTSSRLCECFERDCPSCFAHYHCDHQLTTCNNCEEDSDENARKEIEWKHYPTDFTQFSQNLKRETDCIKAFQRLESEWTTLTWLVAEMRFNHMMSCFEAVKRNILIMGRQRAWLEALTLSADEADAQVDAMVLANDEYAHFRYFAERFMRTSIFSQKIRKGR